MNHSKLTVLFTFAALFAFSSCNECPFQPCETSEIHVKDSISISFSSQAAATFDKLRGIPITMQGMTDLATDLEHLQDEYRTKPLDKELAGIYNAKLEHVCGLYFAWKNADGIYKANLAKQLSAAIDDMFSVLVKYRGCIPIVPPSPCLDASKYRHEVNLALKNLQGEIPNDEWEQLNAANQKYMEDCEKSLNCSDCFDKLIKKYQSL